MPQLTEPAGALNSPVLEEQAPYCVTLRFPTSFFERLSCLDFVLRPLSEGEANG